jgi:hypothetical protein
MSFVPCCFTIAGCSEGLCGLAPQMAVLGGLSKYLRILLTEHFRLLRGTLSLAIMTSEQREVDPRCDAGALTSSQSRLMANHHRHTRRSTLAQSSTLFIGMDVHTETIAVADVVHDHGAEVAYLGTIGTRPCDIAQLVRKLHSTAKHPVLIYDAGPCGSWLSRDLSHKGDDRWVVAPSLIPKTAGDRVKSAPPRRHTSSFTQRSVPSPNTPHASRVWHKHATITSKRGACTRWLRPSRRCGGGSSSWRSQRWQKSRP